MEHCYGSEGLQSFLNLGAINGCDPILLIVPSLVNRSYILNLNERRSMVAYLKTQKIHPIIIDWHEPGIVESQYAIEDYVNCLIQPIIRFLVARYGKKLMLAGYCLGGILAVASCQMMPNSISALILMAMPWNFDHNAYNVPKWLVAYLNRYLDQGHSLDKEMLQLLFYYISPGAHLERYIRMADLQEATAKADDIIALEQWAHDGISLVNSVAKEYLVSFYMQNQLAKGRYRINGHLLNPTSLAIPVCVATAKKDRIVPAGSSHAILPLLQYGHHIEANTGHVSLVAGRSAYKELWNPLQQWIHSCI